MSVFDEFVGFKENSPFLKSMVAMVHTHTMMLMIIIMILIILMIMISVSVL